MIYGQATSQNYIEGQSNIDSSIGLPQYLNAGNDFLGTDDPTLQACNANGGVLGGGVYFQAIWGKEPFYKRNADGSLQLSGGQPIYNDIVKTTVYGAEVPLNPDEAHLCLQNIYRNAVDVYLLNHRRAGQYPSDSTLRRSYLAGARIGCWSRYSNEGWPPIPQNDRPIPGWQYEMMTGLYLFTVDDIMTWSPEMNHGPGPLGGNYTSDWSYNAYGMVEYLVKAAHRYSALDALHQAPFKWCWFHLPLVDANATEGERYDQKPIVYGKIHTYNGQPWLELYAAWPGLDNQSADLKIWIDKDGARSPTYTIQLANGRCYFLDAWQLPAGFTGLEGQHVKLQFKDQLGVTRTWCGDYRVAP